MTRPPQDDLALIRDLAREAGAMAMAYRERGLEVSSKAGGSPVTDADLAIDALLQERLLAARPDYGWLSEETADDPARLAKRRVFVVDPIDGTRAYVKGAPWFCVAIAVVEDGRPLVGVVEAPAAGETYEATASGGAFLNGVPIKASVTAGLENCAMLGDAALFRHKSWPSPWPAMRVESRNAIAYRMCLVASGQFDAAIALNRKYDWDVAAADLIAREAGAFVTDHKGRPFAFNRPRVWQDSLVCAAPGVHPLILRRTAPIDLPD